MVQEWTTLSVGRHHSPSHRRTHRNSLSRLRIAQLKRDAATRHIPIIVLSAHAMTNDRDMAFAAGGDDFDTKPVRFQQLLGKIESLLLQAVIE